MHPPPLRFAADLPEANDLTAGIMARVPRQERGAISRRTREALSGYRQSLSRKRMMSKLQPTSDTPATPHIVIAQ
jgi:hypothetical protein